MKPAETSTLLEIPIHRLTIEQAVDHAERCIREGRRMQFGMVNAAKIVNMRRDPVLREAVLSSDLILADGMAVVWACRLLGRRLPERVPGIDLMEHLLRRSAERGYRVYCLGAAAEVLTRAVERMRERFPGLNIAGRHHGYFSPEEEPAVVEDIVRCRPDILFVAMSSPRKEQFMARWGSRLNVAVCHGVGGSFDVWAGKVRRAPRLWQQMGLEWLYRVIQEPRRMLWRYLETNVLFCALVFREFIRCRVLGRVPADSFAQGRPGL